MPHAYHHVFFSVRDGVADQEVLDTVRRYRDLAVSKGYINSANDVSFGQVLLPTGDDNEVAKARQMTGDFTWGLTIRLDGQEALEHYIKASPADVQAVNFFALLTEPPHFMAHDHVDQLG